MEYSRFQFLSSEHGWECWGNFPNEVKRLKQLITTHNVKNVIILSGDRHISEFSKINIPELSYPLIDFTSSGFTHAYAEFTKETNRNRIREVVFMPSFGVLKFNFNEQVVRMQMRGENNTMLHEIKQAYTKH